MLRHKAHSFESPLHTYIHTKILVSKHEKVNGEHAGLQDWMLITVQSAARTGQNACADHRGAPGPAAFQHLGGGVKVSTQHNECDSEDTKFVFSMFDCCIWILQVHLEDSGLRFLKDGSRQPSLVEADTGVATHHGIT